MSYARRIFVLLCLPVLLSACFTHSNSLISGNGTLSEVPARFLLAGDDDKSGMIVIRKASSYEIEGSSQIVKLRRIDGANGFFIAEQRSVKNDKVSFVSAIFQKTGANSYDQIVSTGAVKTRAELDGEVRKVLANLSEVKASSRIGYRIHDLDTRQGKAAAQAWIKRKQAKDAAKPAPKAKAPAKPKTKQSGQFHYVEEKDVMTGVAKQYVFAFPKNGTPGKAPFVRLGCYGARERYPVGLTVEWGQPLYNAFGNGGGEPAARITTKFGNHAPMELGWSMSGSQTQTYAPGPGLALAGELASGLLGAFAPGAKNAKLNFKWNNRDIHAAFWNYSQIALRGYARSGQEITMIFDTTGFREVAQNFKSHCRY